MGRRGPRREPTKLKLIKGNPSKRPLDLQAEPAPPVIAIAPEPPRHVTGYGRELWKLLALELTKLGLLTVIDLPKFEVLCLTYNRLRKSEDVLESRGGDWHDENASLKLRAQFRAMASDFGLDPSSRGGMKIEKPKGSLFDRFQARDRK